MTGRGEPLVYNSLTSTIMCEPIQQQICVFRMWTRKETFQNIPRDICPVPCVRTHSPPCNILFPSSKSGSLLNAGIIVLENILLVNNLTAGSACVSYFARKLKYYVSLIDTSFLPIKGGFSYVYMYYWVWHLTN